VFIRELDFAIISKCGVVHLLSLMVADKYLQPNHRNGQQMEFFSDFIFIRATA